MIPARAFFDLIMGGPLDVYDEDHHELAKRLESLGWSWRDELLTRIMEYGVFAVAPILAIAMLLVGGLLGDVSSSFVITILLGLVGFWAFLPLFGREYRIRYAEGRYLRRLEDEVEKVDQPDRGQGFLLEARRRDVDDLGRSGGRR